ncbi:unnamed protein product [Adineta steineri]|uniref:Uncharacterized protein n=1 Tax=Adineta steineri TaxID=433720 RepID=A0A819M2F7_9BILA|nr:unnamed protein product [Adineta steineri]CAF3972799.1 unnamed protein product [Adineta steineri]
MNIDDKPDILLARRSLLNNCQSFRIHPISDIFDPKQNYVGLVSYSTGDIYIKQSDWILKNIPQRRRRQRPGIYLHGRLYYFIYRHWQVQDAVFIGGGFSYLNGIWNFISRTLNAMNDSGRLIKFEETVLQLLIDTLYIDHYWLTMPPDHRIDCKSLAKMERNKTYISCAHPSNVNVNRKLHGTVKELNGKSPRIVVIECIGFDRDFYIHSTAVLNNRSLLYSGKHVEFDITETDQGWKADNVTAVWP